MATELAERPITSKTSLILRIAERYGVEPGKLITSMREVFKNPEVPVTEEAMFRLAMIIDEYKLNPITHELYAFLNKAGQVVPFIGIDGWLRILNSRPEYDGLDIIEADDRCTVTIHRKDRTHPTTITEWLRYCKRNTAPWGQNPPRMLRHKATMQCVRYAFGLGGLYDEDEARQIARGEPPADLPVSAPSAPTTAARVRAVLAQPAPSMAVDAFVGDDWPDSEPPEGVPRTLQEWVEEMARADDQESAALVVDEARGLPIHAELSAAYRAKWTPKE